MTASGTRAIFSLMKNDARIAELNAACIRAREEVTRAAEACRLATPGPAARAASEARSTAHNAYAEACRKHRNALFAK